MVFYSPYGKINIAMDTGFDFFKFAFSTETWTGIFTIGAAIYGGWKAHKAKEAEKNTKSKANELEMMNKIIDELQQERDNDKREISDLRLRLNDSENRNQYYVSERPTRKQPKPIRSPKTTKRLEYLEQESGNDSHNDTKNDN